MADLNLALFEVQIIWQEQLAQQFRHRSISIYMAKVQIRLIGCLPLTLFAHCSVFSLELSITYH